MTSLPKWIDLNGLNKIFKELQSKGESKLVGGCVRDILLGRDATDVDIATTLTPEVAINLLEGVGIRCIPTGMKHGTITAIVDGKNYEITTLRKDVETFGRHATVEYTDDWKEDAKRRDFTINAMYMDLDGKVYDYFNGQQDLKKKSVRFVGNPSERIKEDYLRILRYFRFLSYFGIEHLEEESLKACVEHKDGISQLSGERIRVEMLRICSSQYVASVFDLMDKYDITRLLYIGKLDSKYLNYRFCEDPYINLAAILRCDTSINKEYSKLQSRWRLSNKEGHLLHRLVIEEGLEISGDNAYHKRQMYIHGKDLYKKLITLANIEIPSQARFDELLAMTETLELPNFTINGEDLKKIGYNGSEIGKKLQTLHTMWIESNFELTREQLLNRA